MTQYTLSIVLLIVALGSSVSEAQSRFRLALRDGSTLIVDLTGTSIALSSANVSAEHDVVIKNIRRIEATDDGERLRIEFANGDRITGALTEPTLRVNSVLGKSLVPIEEIRSLALIPSSDSRSSVAPAPITPAEVKPPPLAIDTNLGLDPSHVPQVQFGDLTWDLWRTQWQKDGNRLTAIGKIRPGFEYGHWGSGRGGFAITGNADPTWRDYEISFDFQMKPATREFFHASIPGESRGMHVYVRTQSMSESWNEPDTAYVIGVNVEGGWSLAAYEDFFYKGHGWTPHKSGKVESFVAGKVDQFDPERANRIRVRAEGTTITVWINDEQVTKFVHDDKHDTKPIEFGGFGVEWRFESLGWIGDFTHERLGKLKRRKLPRS